MGSGSEDLVDVDAAAFAVEADGAGDDGEDGVVAAEADAFTGSPFGAALADDDVAGDDLLAAVFFDTEAFAAAVATVFDGTLTFLVSHISREVGGGWGRSLGSDVDGLDLEASHGAAVAFGAVVAFAALVFEVGDLVSAELFEDSGFDGSAADEGVPDAEAAFVAVEEDIAEGDGGADFCVEFFDFDFVA